MLQKARTETHWISVKTLIKYLILIIIAVAFIDGIGKSDSVDTENSIEDLTTEFVTEHVDFSIFDSALHNSRQISSVSAPVLKTVSQRVNNTHKHNFIFVKAGKILNIGIINSIHNNSQNFYYSFIRATHRLISFGRLII